MERWRKYFRSAGADLWTVCEHALALAYQENPQDFPSHRDRLAQKLFAPEKFDLQELQESPRRSSEAIRAVSAHRGSIDEASSDEEEEQHGTPNGNNYDQAQALTEEMEEESLLKRDVFELKETILDSYKPEKEVFDSLQRLELMQLTFDVLKETEIGKAVNSLRKHSSMRVRTLAKQLVSEWKDTVDHWCKSVEDVTAASMAVTSNSPSEKEEHGLPSPPMDEGALLAGRSASIEMSQLFDFMDDETSAGSGNPKGQLDGTPSTLLNNKHGEMRKSSARRINDSDARKKEKDTVSSSNGSSKKDREERFTNGYESRREIEKLEKKAHHSESAEKCFTPGSSNRIPSSKPASDPKELDQKLLAAKRKLQENYQQAENAKRQRTIQVMELEDLPKGGPKRAKAPLIARGKPTSQHRPQTLRR